MLADLHEHAYVVLVVGVFLLVGVQQVLVFLEITNYFSIHSLILQRTVQYNKDLRRDGPVIQVRNVSLKDKLQSPNWTNLVLVFAVQALQKVYKSNQNQR